jgi:hypothetical protein
MNTYTDSIVILRGHLEEIFTALDAATGYHVADDLARQYKNVGGTHRPSNLTKRLEAAQERVAGYLEEGDDVSEG